MRVHFYLTCALLVYLISYIQYVSGKFYSGFTVGRQFQYIGKFCFTYHPTLDELAGRISGEIETNFPGMQIAIYDDENRFWNYIKSKDCDCNCKVSPKHTKRVYNISTTATSVIPYKFDLEIREHLRPRFWYVALARCVPGGGDYVPSFDEITQEDFEKYYFSAWYNIHMIQSEGSELPVEEQGMPIIYAILTVFSGLAVAIQAMAVKGLRDSESFHPIVKLLTINIFMFFLANTLNFLHFYLYQYNGVGVALFECVAKILEVFVRVGTILLGMMIAKGWTINSVILEGQEKLSCFMVVFLGLYISMAMWYLIWLDPASTLYIYDSWPGVGICALQLTILAWFLFTIMETRDYEEAQGKRRFFLRMCILFTVYMVTLPVLVVIASFLSPWVREKVVAGVSLSIEYCIYVSLIYLLWPSRAPRYFERLYSVSSLSEKSTLRDTSLPIEQL